MQKDSEAARCGCQDLTQLKRQADRKEQEPLWIRQPGPPRLAQPRHHGLGAAGYDRGGGADGRRRGRRQQRYDALVSPQSNETLP